MRDVWGLSPRTTPIEVDAIKDIALDCLSRIVVDGTHRETSTAALGERQGSAPPELSPNGNPIQAERAEGARDPSEEAGCPVLC